MSPTKQAEPAKSAPNVGELIDAWFAQSVTGTPVATDTGVYNQLFAAKEDLKQRIATALKGE